MKAIALIFQDECFSMASAAPLTTQPRPTLSKGIQPFISSRSAHAPLRRESSCRAPCVACTWISLPDVCDAFLLFADKIGGVAVAPVEVALGLASPHEDWDQVEGSRDEISSLVRC